MFCLPMVSALRGGKDRQTFCSPRSCCYLGVVSLLGVRVKYWANTRLFASPPLLELQGHAIKNQDLLIASGAVSLKGSDSMKALEEDVEAVSYLLLTCALPYLGR